LAAINQSTTYFPLFIAGNTDVQTKPISRTYQRSYCRTILPR
jgi:hypothetical protein